MAKRTVTFLGREYDVEDCMGMFNPGSKMLIGLERWPIGGDPRWEAYTDGPIYSLGIEGKGKTPQAAAKDLEKKCFKEFAKIGKALGYDVEK